MDVWLDVLFDDASSRKPSKPPLMRLGSPSLDSIVLWPLSLAQYHIVLKWSAFFFFFFWAAPQAHGVLGPGLGISFSNAGSFNPLCWQGLNLHPGSVESPLIPSCHSGNSEMEGFEADVSQGLGAAWGGGRYLVIIVSLLVTAKWLRREGISGPTIIPLKCGSPRAPLATGLRSASGAVPFSPYCQPPRVGQ